MTLTLRGMVSSLWLIALGSCGDTEDRQEVLDGLRGIGFVSAPLVSQPSSTDTERFVEITGYGVVPLGETATISPYQDQSPQGVPVAEASTITIDPSSYQYTAYQHFQLLTFKAQVKIPS